MGLYNNVNNRSSADSQPHLFTSVSFVLFIRYTTTIPVRIKFTELLTIKHANNSIVIIVQYCIRINELIIAVL